VHRCGGPGWPRGIEVLLHQAVLVLVEASQADAQIQADVPSEDLLPSIRLPFPQMLVMFGAGFEIGRFERSRLPGWRDGPDQLGLAYEPWLVRCAEAGGDLIGVLLLAGSGRDGLGGRCVWIVEVEGQFIPIPSWRGRSALDPIAQNLAAALCFGSWTSGGPAAPRRATLTTGRPNQSGSRPAAPPRSEVHEIVVRPRKPPSTQQAGSGPGFARHAHIRRGHWHRYRIGPVDHWHYEWRWIGPTSVNGSWVADTPTTVYRLPQVLFT
jgi:hypothetical protein